MSDIRYLFDRLLDQEPPLADSREIIARATKTRRRRIGGSLAGVGAVAAAGGVVIGMAAAPATSSVAQHGTVPHGVPVSAPAVFLTAARNAAKARQGTGRFWYTQVRTRQEIVTVGGSGRSKLSKGALLPHAIFDTTTQRNWQGLDGTVHVADGLDPKITFATPADRAAWRAAGSPTWMFTRRSSYTEKLPALPPDKRGTLGADVSLRNAPRLPASTAGLRAVLRIAYRTDPSGMPDFASFAYEAAADVFTAPTTPATRAAMYQILATLPGVRVLGEVTDSLGRAGVALARPESSRTDDPDLRILVVDPATGRLLADQARPTAGRNKGLLVFSETFAAANWTSQVSG